MIRWQRLSVDVRGGLCGAEIWKGQPVKVIEIATVRHPMFRGECCDGQAPAAVPHKFEPRPKAIQAFPWASFRHDSASMFDRLAMRDVKQQQAGRDPGEDDD